MNEHNLRFLRIFVKNRNNTLSESVCNCANPVWKNDKKPKFWKEAQNVKENYAGHCGGSISGG